MSEEIWKDIRTIPYYQPGWPFHQVSNRGRVRVLPGGYVKSRLIKETELRILSLSHGYMEIRRHDINHRYKVHHLVLNQFVGPCPPRQECRHLNGNRSDNRWPENLAWGTVSENERDKILHGTDNRGERNGQSVLTEAAVLDIKTRLEYRGVVTELAKQYNVSLAAVSMIRNGHRWSNPL